MHLLLIEDNPGDVFLLREASATFIEQGSLQCSTVTDGTQALAFLRQQAPYTQVASPDVIFLDLNLPGTSGYEVLAELQQDPELQFIPVVVLTSSSEQKDINQCYELGANAYLVKPMELEQALSLLRSTVTFWSGCKFHMLKG